MIIDEIQNVYGREMKNNMQVDEGESSDEDSLPPPLTTQFECYFRIEKPNGLGVERAVSIFNGLIPAHAPFD